MSNNNTSGPGADLQNKSTAPSPSPTPLSSQRAARRFRQITPPRPHPRVPRKLVPQRGVRVRVLPTGLRGPSYSQHPGPEVELSADRTQAAVIWKPQSVQASRSCPCVCPPSRPGSSRRPVSSPPSPPREPPQPRAAAAAAAPQPRAQQWPSRGSTRYGPEGGARGG